MMAKLNVKRGKRNRRSECYLRLRRNMQRYQIFVVFNQCNAPSTKRTYGTETKVIFSVSHQKTNSILFILFCCRILCNILFYYLQFMQKRLFILFSPFFFLNLTFHSHSFIVYRELLNYYKIQRIHSFVSMFRFVETQHGFTLNFCYSEKKNEPILV